MKQVEVRLPIKEVMIMIDIISAEKWRWIKQSRKEDSELVKNAIEKRIRDLKWLYSYINCAVMDYRKEELEQDRKRLCHEPKSQNGAGDYEKYIKQ